MSATQRPSNSSAHQSSTFIQPNSEANWHFTRHLIRAAASIGIAAAFLCNPAANRILAHDSQPAGSRIRLILKRSKPSTR